MNLNELFVKINEVKTVDTRSDPRQEIQPAMVAGGRKPHLEYKEKMAKGVLDRVTVELSGKDSETTTKLAKKYKEIDNLTKQLTTLRDSFNVDAKEHVLDLFDAQDEVLTRVVETASLTLTLSKKTVRTDTEINFEEFYKELLTLLPELEDKLKILLDKYTKVSKHEVSPSLRVRLPGDEPDEDEVKSAAKKAIKKSKKESIEITEAQDGFWSQIAELSHHFLNAFKKWGKNYDRKLEHIKQQMAAFAIGESEEDKESETDDEGYPTEKQALKNRYNYLTHGTPHPEKINEARMSEDMYIEDMYDHVKEAHSKATEVTTDLRKLEMTALRVASGNEPGTDVEFERKMSDEFKKLSFEAEELADKIKKLEFQVEDKIMVPNEKKEPIHVPESIEVIKESLDNDSHDNMVGLAQHIKKLASEPEKDLELERILSKMLFHKEKMISKLSTFEILSALQEMSPEQYDATKDVAMNGI